MDATGAKTIEAKLLNPEPPTFQSQAQMQQERGVRMAMFAQLPDGRCWDEAHLELVKNINEQWAPFTHTRKLLIEAGARNVSSAILMTEREQQQWSAYIDALEGKRGEEALRTAKAEGSGIKPFTLREL